MDRGSRKVTLAVASSLPNEEDLLNNAFSNSFHFDPRTRTLYIREEKLESVGDFSMLLVHTLAHISADPKGIQGSLGNDNDPKFGTLKGRGVLWGACCCGVPVGWLIVAVDCVLWVVISL